MNHRSTAAVSALKLLLAALVVAAAGLVLAQLPRGQVQCEEAAEVAVRPPNLSCTGGCHLAPALNQAECGAEGRREGWWSLNCTSTTAHLVQWGEARCRVCGTSGVDTSSCTVTYAFRAEEEQEEATYTMPDGNLVVGVVLVGLLTTLVILLVREQQRSGRSVVELWKEVELWREVEVRREAEIAKRKVQGGERVLNTTWPRRAGQ